MRADPFLDFVLDLLREVPGVTARAMFGGHGLYRGAAFFGVVYKGRLYFRTAEATRVKYVERGCEAFRPSEKQTLSSYYEVPADVLEDREQLAAWADEAADTATDTRQAKRSR